MGRSLDDSMAALPKARRRKIEARSTELVDGVEGLEAFRQLAERSQEEVGGRHAQDQAALGPKDREADRPLSLAFDHAWRDMIAAWPSARRLPSAPVVVAKPYSAIYKRLSRRLRRQRFRLAFDGRRRGERIASQWFGGRRDACGLNDMRFAHELRCEISAIAGPNYRRNGGNRQQRRRREPDDSCYKKHGFHRCAPSPRISSVSKIISRAAAQRNRPC